MGFNQNIVSKLNARYYPHPPRDLLDAAFCAFAGPGMKILDAACSNRGLCIKAPLKKMYIVGIDIDSAVHNNPTCDESIVHDLSKTFPFEDDSFDLIHCRWAIEHLEYPEKAFCEFARILKPGGKLICLTPNVYHYAVVQPFRKLLALPLHRKLVSIIGKFKRIVKRKWYKPVKSNLIG